MTWYPVAFLPPQYVDSAGDPHSGAVLKAYEEGTTTVISMATDSTGATRATSFALNASGYPESGGSVIIPHIQEDYKLALYPDQASADADSGAVWTYDNIKIADVQNSAFVQSFSGDGSTVSFTLTEDLGTDENTIMVFADMLDEYSTNGTFAADTDWTKGTGWTIATGVATGATASTDLEQDAAITLIEGESYTVTFTMSNRTAGSVTPKIGGTSGTARSADGTYTETILAGSTQKLEFTGSGFTGDIDNVTVHRVNSAVRKILRPDEFTLTNTDLTLDVAPETGTNNIVVFAPSLLFGAVGAAAAAAATSETNAAASELLASQWATLTTGIVDSTDYSAKAWAIGGTGVTDTATRGAAKEWAIETASTVDTSEYSAKEYAIGTQIRGAASGGSAKDWATYTAGTADNTDYSAKEWAIGTQTRGVASSGSAKDWATYTTSTVDDAGYSAKEWAIGTQTRGIASSGSAKDWATYTAGTVDDTEYSAKYYSNASSTSASNASASATAAAASAASATAAAAGGLYGDVVSKSFADSPIVPLLAEEGTLYRVDTSGGNVVINLSALSVYAEDTKFAFVKTTGDANTITINRGGTDTIDGGTSATISNQYEVTVFVGDSATGTWVAAVQAAGSSTFSDGTFQIYNAVDATKILDFDLSNITTGNSRTLTAPNRDWDMDWAAEVCATNNRLGKQTDTNTYIDFTAADKIIFYAGGISMLELREASTDLIMINSGYANVDTRIYADNGYATVAVDASQAVALLAPQTGSPTVTSSEAKVEMQNTDSCLLPRGTTAQRPATGVAGMIRYNSTDGNVEVYQGGAWVAVGGASLGGTWADWKPQYNEVIGRFAQSDLYGSTFNSYLDMAVLDTNLTVIACHHAGNSYKRYIIANRVSTDGGMASQQSISASATDSRANAVCKMDTNKYLSVCSDNTGTNIQSIAGTIATTGLPTITEGSRVDLEAANTTYGIQAKQIGTDKALVVYHRFTSADIVGKIITTSGTTVTDNGGVTVSNGTIPNTYGVGAEIMSSTRAVAAWKNASGYPQLGLFGGINTTTITDLGEAQLEAVSIASYGMGCAKVDDNTVLVVYGETTNRTIRYALVDITSDTISTTASGVLTNFVLQKGYSIKILDLGSGVSSLIIKTYLAVMNLIITCTTSTVTLSAYGPVFIPGHESEKNIVAHAYDSSADEVFVISQRHSSAQQGIYATKLKKSLS